MPSVDVEQAIGPKIARRKPDGYTGGQAEVAGHHTEGAGELLTKATTTTKECLDRVVAVAVLHIQVILEVAEPVLQCQRLLVRRHRPGRCCQGLILGQLRQPSWKVERTVRRVVHSCGE